MDELRLNEAVVSDLIRQYLVNKPNGNWHEDLTVQHRGHDHGADLVLTGGKYNGERFIIECKGKSYTQNAASARSINKEGWLVALGQIITRMDAARVIQTGTTKGGVNRAYRYGLGLYWVSAQVALCRIPRRIANVLNLYVFSVYEDGYVKQWTPKDFGKQHSDSDFMPPRKQPMIKDLFLCPDA